MSLEKWTTLRTADVHVLAQELATQQIPSIAQLEPIADCEELITFAEANPTPIEFTPQHPAWRLESVAARIIEGIAVAAHEPLTEFGYRELARILLEHAAYLYAYPDDEPRPRLEAGSALALAGCVCASLPQSELWRLTGFGRTATAFPEVAPTPTDAHLILPIEVAFSLANERRLPILASAVDTYNAVLEPDFTPQKRFDLPLSDRDFFHTLNLDFPGMAAVKAAVLSDDISGAKSGYATFRRQFLKDFVDEIRNSDAVLLERSDTYTTAKTYLECLLRLSIHPTPAIRATTEIRIATQLFPEFRGSEQLRTLALRRYKWITDTFFHTDGFHKDRTLRSQVEAIADFTRFLSVYGGPAPCAHDLEKIQTLLEKLVATCIHLSQPDLSFPPLGPLPVSNFDVVELCNIADSNFKCPGTTSHALPETGCYVMRDNWETDAQYLFFDARPSRKPNDTPTSNLVLYAHGRQLMTGAARVLNTPPLAFDPLDTRWLTTPTFDFVEKWDKTVDVQHKRAIFYLSGEYFILHDLLLGTEAQTLEQTFHLGEDIDVYIDVDVKRAWTQDEHRSNLFIEATGTAGFAVALDGDSVIYRSSEASPAVLNTLLLPMRPGIKAHPTISAIPVHADADVLATGFTLELQHTTDTFLISDDGLAEMSTEDITFVGEYLFLRRGVSDNVQFIMLNGRFLKAGTQVLVDLDEPRESYAKM
ncbi:hypothetical protein J5I95_02300 [Candidatus Poribacteria bacterium]|nr:hypothetical protein [Candidatus Poribacteria bacterium]